MKIQARLKKECSLSLTFNAEKETIVSDDEHWHDYEFQFDLKYSNTNKLITITTEGNENCYWAVGNIEGNLTSKHAEESENAPEDPIIFSSLKLIALGLVIILIFKHYYLKSYHDRLLDNDRRNIRQVLEKPKFEVCAASLVISIFHLQKQKVSFHIRKYQISQWR